MERFFLSLSLLLGVLWGYCPLTALAQEVARTPSDYFVEQWLAGTVGGLITGPAMERLTIFIYCGPEEENPSTEKALCQGFGTIVFRTIFYVVGIPLGVSTAVILDGWVHGINGSIGATISMSITGAISWVLWATVLNWGIDQLAERPGYEFLIPWVEPVKTLITIFWPTMMTSLMATLAFESGATFKKQKTAESLQLHWTMPVFSIRF
jgi:hypothetical protein